VIVGKPIFIRSVLFDLDGTLVDSLPDLLNAANYMLAALSRPKVQRSVLEAYIGNGVVRMVKRLLTGSMDGDPPELLCDDALNLFKSYYYQHICESSMLYPEVMEGLALLHDRGFRLGVVTNKSNQFTHPLLEGLGIGAYFSAVVSGDTLDLKKPAPEPLWYAASLLESRPEETLMIGDSVNDIHAARSAGCPIFCVSYGYRGGLNADDMGADSVIQSILKINELIVPASVGKNLEI